MSSFDDGPSTLVSAKLQGVALRTPPPCDTYIMECIVHPSEQEYSSSAAGFGNPMRRILRLTNHATAMDLLHQLNLVSAELLTCNSSAATADVACSSADVVLSNAVSITSGGVRTQLFAVHPASGDGTPFLSTREADLLSQRPIRECLSLRFPFTVAVTPVLPVAQTASWTAEQWTSALHSQHRAQLTSENDEHAIREASMKKPTSGADVIKSTAVAGGSSKSLASRRNLPVSGFGASSVNISMEAKRYNDDETNIIVTPAAASNDLSPPQTPEHLFVGGAPPSLFVPEERCHSLSPGNTPRTPMGATRRRTSSVSLSNADEVAPTAARASPSGSRTRQEKRVAAQEERQRLLELQRVREQNIANKERESQSKAQAMQAHVAKRENERSAQTDQDRKTTAERQARIDSRTQRSLESKRSLQEQHAARILAKKLEYQELMESALRSSELWPPAANAALEPFAFDPTVRNELGVLSVDGHRRVHVADRKRSVVDLPDAHETELSRLERDQAKENFVNRVAASRKSTERRMSKFSAVKLHPFVVHAELKSLLENLDADAHSNAKRTECQQRMEREQQHEHATSEYHRRVMDDSIRARVELKMERKVRSIEHHAQQIAFEKVKKQTEEEGKKQKEMDAKARIQMFYERKRQDEIAAQELARRQKEMVEYIDRQKAALHTLIEDNK